MLHKWKNGSNNASAFSEEREDDIVGDIAIKLEGVWKIFGTRAEEAMAAVRAEGLSKSEVLARFGAVIGIADVSFDVRQGEIFCIMGLSGSGKSTLIRHINRLIEPTAGRVEVLGQDVTRLSEPELRAYAVTKDRNGLSAHGAVATPLRARQCRVPARNPRRTQRTTLGNLATHLVPRGVGWV